MISHPDWSTKKILILGFGAEGRANLDYARLCGANEIAIADKRANLGLSSDELGLFSGQVSGRSIRQYTGDDWLKAIYDYDIILRSPGVPLRYLEELKRTSPRTVVTSGTEIFLSHKRDKVIAVTGTKGKSTTTSLIHHILVLAGIEAKLGGNIGLPALKLINQPASLYVLELSSYQLADINLSPNIAVFLNLYPEHLDHHGDFKSYGEAKAKIAAFQTAHDKLILPSEIALLKELTTHSNAQRIYWGAQDTSSWIADNHFYYRCGNNLTHRVCDLATPKIKGPGNQRNILACLAAISHFCLDPSLLAEAIATFYPLPHRLEDLGIFKGVRFINDSISTVPEATINALETFGDGVTTVILGGFDRGVSFNQLADRLINSSVRTIILFPPSGARIASALYEHPKFSSEKLKLFSVSDMVEAVRLAISETPRDSICLLSPASPSFPIFKNFEERGEAFRVAVQNTSR